MWSFYSYKFLLPALIVAIALFLFIKLREDREHHGWWLAFLLFSVSLALAIPFKTNPFQHNLTAYQKGETTVAQIHDLYHAPLLQAIELSENVTKQNIEALEKEIPKLTKGQQKSAKKGIEKAWDGWNNQYTLLFFIENIGYEPDVFISTPHLARLKPEYIPEAYKLLDKLKGSDLKRTLTRFLESSEELLANEENY